MPSHTRTFSEKCQLTRIGTCLRTRINYDPYAESTRGTRAGGTPDGELTDGTNGEYQTLSNYWEVPNALFSWMKEALLEGKDNRYLGSNFVLQLPDNDFAIVPIFQGKSSIMSELEVKINGYAIKTVWSRSQGIQVKDADKQVNPDADGWMNIGYYDGYSNHDKATMKSEYHREVNGADSKGTALPLYPSYTDEADAVRAKPIYFRSKNKIGLVQEDNYKGFMYLSLHNIDKAYASWANDFEGQWDGTANEWTTIGHRLTSINPEGHMLALNVPAVDRPSSSDLPNISEDGSKPSEVLLIACEDANGAASDHDVNDVAFLIIGYPNVPTVVPTKQVIEKRYMCEDLGGTYDYDFNDIVVDCKQTQEFRIDYSPATSDLSNHEQDVAGNITITDMVPVGCPVQTAKISRLCGTIPIQVRIGDFMFPKIKDPSTSGEAAQYTTRKELIHEKYRNYCDGNHSGRNCSCASHAVNTTSGTEMSHENITRADGDVKTTNGWNPNEEQIIPCHTWNPTTNNIIIYADWGYYKTMYSAGSISATEWAEMKQNNPFPENTQDFADFANGNKFPVTFPKTGELPFIIATDVTVPWMNESQHIPENWITGDFSTTTGADLVGNCFYMENYPNADGEGYIWSGDVTGIADITGVVIKPNTAEMAAIAESQDGGRNYLLLHVYCELPAGESGSVGICSASDWTTLFSTDADGHFALPLSQRVHQTYALENGSTLACATIYLTNDQWNTMRNQGFVVTSRTNGLRIKKITTARPCMYDGTNATTTVDPGFVVNINKSELAKQKTGDQYWGTVMSNESERILMKKEEASSRTLVPFESQKFISGTGVELTARGARGYKLVQWNGVADANKHDNPLILTHTASSATDSKTFTVYPTFVAALDPNLQLEDGTTTTTITLVNNGVSYALPVLSENTEATYSLLQTYGLNESIVTASPSISGGTHYLTLTPKAVGETSFIIYQKEGRTNNYGVSGEINVTVKVVDASEIPSTDQNLASWMVRWWNSGASNAYIVNDGGISLVNKTNEDVTSEYGNNKPIFGHPYGNYRQYIDFPQGTALVIEVNSGEIEVHFNKQYGTGDYPDSNGDRIIVSTKQNTEYCKAIFNRTAGKKTYIIDLAAIRQRYGYVHLNSICSLNGAANVASMAVKGDYSPQRARWGQITENRSKANLNVTIDDINEWSSYGQNVQPKPQNTSDYVFLTEQKSNGAVVFGKSNSGPMHAVDLTTATILVVTANKANSNSVFFQFNKTDWDTRKDVNVSDYQYCAAKEDGDNILYMVDLDKLRNDMGVNYLFLNAINAGWGGNLQISKIEVDSKRTNIAELTNGVSSAAPNKKTDNGWINARVASENEEADNVFGQEKACVFGCEWNQNTAKLYDDLTNQALKYIKVTVYSGYEAPRFFFNYRDGSGSDGFVVSTSDNSKYLLSKVVDGGIEYYVNATALRSAKEGALYINSIRSSSSSTLIKVSDVKYGIVY